MREALVLLVKSCVLLYNVSMKIYAVSDLHISTDSDKPMDVFGGNWVGYMDKIRADWKERVSDGDVVLIGGDIRWAMTLPEAEKDLATISDLKGIKVLVKGNHDYWWQHSVSKVREILPDGFYAVQNDAVKSVSPVVCGSRCWSVPGSPDFGEQDMKIYLRETERLKLSFAAAAKLKKDGDKLVALVHFPPFTGKREDTDFTRLFEKNGVDAVVYGHLHGNKVKNERLIEKNGIKYYLTSCDQTDNKLTEIVL